METKKEKIINGVSKSEYQRQYFASLSKDHRKGYKLKEYYGMSIDDYNLILKKQKYKCAICGKHESEQVKRLSVDHNHKCGSIRGLLCDACNRGLGFFRDNHKILSKAIKYLQDLKHGNKILLSSGRNSKVRRPKYSNPKNYS